MTSSQFQLPSPSANLCAKALSRSIGMGFSLGVVHTEGSPFGTPPVTSWVSILAGLFRDMALFDQAKEGLDDPRVELTPRPAADFHNRFLDGHGALVARGADHRIEGVADRDDSGFKRDRISGQPLGVACSVVPFVMTMDDRRDILPEPDAPQHSIADLGVRLAQLRIRVQVFFDLEHSDVVQQ